MDNRLEMMLTEIGDMIEWPQPSVGFAPRVISRIATQPARQPVLRRFLPAFGLLGILVAAIITFSPSTRAAVADLLGIGGVRIGFGAEKDLPRPTPGSSLDLGDAVTLDRARQLADFDVAVPALLGSPDQVYFDAIVPSGMVSLVYEATPSLGAAPGTDVAVLITQFRGGMVEDEGYFKKLSARSTLVRVEVKGTEGIWMTGSPHSFFYEKSGRIVEETVRLVENVLLWEQDGVTLRIETAGTLEQALAIAESFSSDP
jgi:hypothetical protein